MKKNKRVTGQLIVSAPVDTTPAEAALPDSTHSATRQAFIQLGRALAAFGPFGLGCDMSFVEAGIKLDVFDSSKEQNAEFDQAAFEEFVRRAHDTCARVLDKPGEASKQLATNAKEFAAAEGRNVDAVRALFESITTHPGASLISTDGELIDIGIAVLAGDQYDSDLEIEVARIRRLVRIKTPEGQYDTSPDHAVGLQVGKRIHPEGVETPSGAPYIRADRIDAMVDPSGELFDELATA